MNQGPESPHALMPLRARPRDREESRLEQLTSSGGPLRRVLAALCARLLETRGHEMLGFARLGDYARERIGISARQLQDLAHAHRAFADMPGLERALIENDLPWSKVRLLTRVATAEDEGAWLARARDRSTRRLEATVRAARRQQGRANEPEDDPVSNVHIRLRCTPAVRERWMQTRELAERVAGQRLRAEEALEWVTAEAFSAVSIDAHEPMPLPTPQRPDCEVRKRAGANAETEPNADANARPNAESDERCGEPACAGETPGRAPRSDAWGPAARWLEPLLHRLDEVDAFELDRRLREAFRLEQTLDAAIAPLLRVVTSTEYEWKSAFWTLAGYAAERLGMSASKARALLRIEQAGDVCPPLREAFRDGRLSWIKAQCLVPLLLLDIPGELPGDLRREQADDLPGEHPSEEPTATDWRARWVAWAERITVRRLESDVERALLLRAGHGRAFERCKADPERAQDPIPETEQQMCAPDIDVDATEQLEWRLPREVAWLFRAVRTTWQARIRAERGGAAMASESEVFAALLDHATATWTFHEPGRRRPDPVFERDGYRCAVPGCSSRRNLHDHHVVFRSAGGSDSPENRVTLCAFHHQRGVHAGRLRVHGHAPDHLVFELGVRRGLSPLARYRSGDIAL